MQLNALLCVSSQETLQSSSSIALKKKPRSHQRIAFLLLLTIWICGSSVCAISGGQPIFEEADINIRSQNQQQKQGELPQLQQLKQQQLQWSCAATPWVVLSGHETTSRRVSVSEGAYFVPNATVSLTSPTVHGGDCEARQPVEAAAAPAASDKQEEEATPQNGGRRTRSSQDAVVTTTGVATFYTEQQHEQREQQENTLEQQQVQTPQTYTETPGFFSTFKGLATADTNAIVAWGKGLNGTLNSGQFESKPSRQKQHLQRLQHSLLFPSPYSFAASTSSEHARYILAGAATEAASDGTEAPPRHEGHEGAEMLLPAKLQQRRQNLHGLVPTAACSWGLSAIWLIQWCYSLCTSIVPAALAATSTEEGTASAASVARCSCVSSHMPVLLRSEPLWQQEQPHQQRQQREAAARLVPVLQQRALLLCCAEGSPASQEKQQLQLRGVFSRGDTEEHTEAVASAPAVAELVEETLTRGQHTEPITRSADEASPPPETVDAAGAADFSGPVSAPRSDSYVKNLPSTSGGQQQAELRKEQPEYMGAFSASHEAREEQGQKFKAQDELQGKMQRSEQEEDQKHLELFSRWGGQLVSWTWRRSCMRQQQSPRPQVAVTESAGIAAAAHCYRPHASTSLALQLLLLLLPRDMVLRLLADRDLKQCQQPLPQQQRTQKEQSQSCKKQVDLPRVSVTSPAARTASKTGSCTGSIVHSNGDFKTRETCDARLLNGGSSYAFKAVGAGSYGHKHQLDPLKLSKFYGSVPSQLQSSWGPYTQLAPRQQFLQNESQRNTDTSIASQQEGEHWQKLQEWQQNAAPQEQQQQEQQQQQLRESEVQEMRDSRSAAALATAAAKQHTNVEAQGATSAVGGVPGAPRLYGRGFVQGGHLPASFLRLHFNFASLDAGARIIASSGGMQHIKAVQRPDADTYMLVPCYLPSKYFVLSFSETLKIDFVVVQSFEIYANAFWHIQLLGADTYPTRQWRLIANLETAADVSSELFDLKSECAALGSCWAKFLKVRLLTHHDEGPHYYCSLTSFQVFGATGVQFLETQIHDEFGGTTQKTGVEASDVLPASNGPAGVATLTADSASLALDAKDTRGSITASPDVQPHHNGAHEGPPLRPGKLTSAPLSPGFPRKPPPQNPLQHGRHKPAAGAPQREQGMRGGFAIASAPELLSQRCSSSEEATAASLTQGCRTTDGSVGDDASGDRRPSYQEQKQGNLGRTKNVGALLDPTPAAAPVAATPADTEAGFIGNNSAQKHDLQRNLPLSEEGIKQRADAFVALSSSLFEAVKEQQAQNLTQVQEHQPKVHQDVLAHDADWIGTDDPHLVGHFPQEALSVRSKPESAVVCAGSTDINGKSRWIAGNPLFEPTTIRFFCSHNGVNPETAAPTSVPVPVKKMNKTPPGHHTNSNDSQSGKDQYYADAATEALQHAAAYARTFLVSALQQQQQPQQLQRSPISTAFLQYLMKTTPGNSDLQTEILEVLSQLLQPPKIEASSKSGGANREATRGGAVSPPVVGPRDTKGEHVLVMLLERMKSLEGETAAFRSAAAERQQQLQLQQEQLLHLTLLVQLQQQVGFFLFERLGAFDGLIPHVSPLVQLLDESEPSTPTTATASQKGRMIRGTDSDSRATSDQQIDARCDLMNGSTGVRKNRQPQNEQQQQQHGDFAGHGSSGWLWSAVEQLLQPLETLWHWLVLPLVRWGSSAICFAGFAAELLRRSLCSNPESVLLQQSCAAVSWVYRAAAFVALTFVNTLTRGADFACRGVSFSIAQAALTWNRLSSAMKHVPQLLPLDWPTERSECSSSYWGRRFLMLQDRGIQQYPDTFAAMSVLLLLCFFLAIGGALFWRMRHGQRVAAAAAGECALLRRSFELLQQQHHMLLSQLEKYEREQQLLLLLTASNHSVRSSRLLVHRSKHEESGADFLPRQPDEHDDSVIRLENLPITAGSAGVQRLPAVTHTEDPFECSINSDAQETIVKRADPAPSLLRRLSTSLAPRVLLGLARNAPGAPHVAGAAREKEGNYNQTANAAVLHSSGQDGEVLQPQLRIVQQQEGECGPQPLIRREQQIQQDQQPQTTAAALLPTLDTKAIRSLKLQRHTLRQRRLGGATTPVASPAAAVPADGEHVLLPTFGAGTEVCLRTRDPYIPSGAEVAGVAALSGAPSRSSSSRSSSVCSTSSNLQGASSSLFKSLWTSQLPHRGLLPLTLQPTQRQRGKRALAGHEGCENPDGRASSAGGGSGSSIGFGEPLPEHGAFQHHSSCHLPIRTVVSATKETAAESGDPFDSIAGRRAATSASCNWGHIGIRSTKSSNFADVISSRDPNLEPHQLQQQDNSCGRSCTDMRTLTSALPHLGAAPEATHSSPFLRDEPGRPGPARQGEHFSYIVSSRESQAAANAPLHTDAAVEIPETQPEPVKLSHAPAVGASNARRDGRRRRKRRGAS